MICWIRIAVLLDTCGAHFGYRKNYVNIYAFGEAVCEFEQKKNYVSVDKGFGFVFRNILLEMEDLINEGCMT